MNRYFRGGVSAAGVLTLIFALWLAGYCWQNPLVSASTKTDLQICANPGGLLLYALNCQRAQTVQRGGKKQVELLLKVEPVVL